MRRQEDLYWKTFSVLAALCALYLFWEWLTEQWWFTLAAIAAAISVVICVVVFVRWLIYQLWSR